MTDSKLPKLYRFVDNSDRILCEIIAVTYEEAVVKAGNELLLKADCFIEVLEGDEPARGRKARKKRAPFAAINGNGLLARLFSKNRQ